MEPIRLQKFFTDSGVLSRRAAEAAIRAGEVTVNGAPAGIGQKIDPERDVVAYRGKTVLRREDAPRRVLMLHKPRGFVTTLHDERGRHTVAELVADAGGRVYPVGRLDMDSDGLFLLTDDGDLCERLTHPAHEIPKIYRVTVRGGVTAAQLQTLRAPFVLDGYTTRPAEVEVADAAADTALTVKIHEGRNRQIRRMCEAVGLSILQLTRVAVGDLRLGDLPVGTYRLLTETEIAYLKGSRKEL